MLYVDTSVLVPLVIPEPMSGVVERWFEAAETGTLMTSGWTTAEFASAIDNKVRRKELSETSGSEAFSIFETHVVPALRIATIDETDFRVAAKFMVRFELGLRAGDALHLAIAQRTAATGLVSLDRRFSDAAQALSLHAMLLRSA